MISISIGYQSYFQLLLYGRLSLACSPNARPLLPYFSLCGYVDPLVCYIFSLIILYVGILLTTYLPQVNRGRYCWCRFFRAYAINTSDGIS
jgi:hypothetical protein